MPIRRIAAMVVVLGLFVWTSAGSAADGWQAGTAVVKITPEKPLWMAGYGSRKAPSEGTLHDLHVKALALKSADGQTAVLVTSDILGFTRGTSEAISAEAKKRFGLQRRQLMLTSSHTHCGPVLAGALYDIYPLSDQQRADIEEYTKKLVGKVVDAIGQAIERMAPATLSAGEGETTFAANRRNNTDEAQVVKLRAEGKPTVGPSDHSVPVLAVRSPAGQLRAVAFGYACHNTTLAFQQFCGDYAGFAQIDVEKAHPGAVAMFYMGCGSDQNPLPRRSVELCEKYGQMLATAVDDVVKKPLRPIKPTLRTAYKAMDLPFDGQFTREEAEKVAKSKGYDGQWARRLLKELDEGKPWAKSYPVYPVQVWKLGDDQLWVVLGGEVVVDYSLRLKQIYGPHTWVTGYANDVMSYIPSHRIWQEGRYESGAFAVYGLPTQRWIENIEDRILACIEELVKEVK